MRNLIFLSFLIWLTGCVKLNPDLTTSFTPVVTIPNAPINLKGAVSKSTQIDLTWTDSSNNEEGFKIERKSGTDAYKLIATLNHNVMTYSDKSIVDPTNWILLTKLNTPFRGKVNRSFRSKLNTLFRGKVNSYFDGDFRLY